MAGEGQQLSLRERKKLRTRNELTAAALRLFSERGFDHVTIEEIAAAVEVSPSTFVRYFERKEDALLADHGQFVTELAAAIAARPADEPVIAAVRHALLAMVDGIDLDDDTLLATSRIMLNTPSLKARSLEHQIHWEGVIAETIADRLGVDATTDLQVRMVAATSIAAFRVAVELWVAADADRPLHAYLNDALDVLDATRGFRLVG